MKKKFLIYCILFTVLCHSIDFHFWDSLKSYAIIYFYDKTQNNLLHEKGIDFYIPSGAKTKKHDWYPLMLHHDASEHFSKYINKDVSLNILYSFGDFDFSKGSASFYDPSSPYYASFYGGYVIFCKNGDSYGFHQNGEVNIAEIQKLPMFDQTHLVLPSVGCSKDEIYFQSYVEKIEKHQPYIGLEKWTKIDAIIQTNSPIHKNTNKKNIGYIQYGKPHKDFYMGKNYPIITLKGRIYVKYIDQWKGTFFLYIMTRDAQTLDTCDKELLSKSYIHAFKKREFFK